MALSENELLILSGVFYSTKITRVNIPNITLGELARDMVNMDSNLLRETLSGGFVNQSSPGFDGPEAYKTLMREVIASPTLSGLDIRYPHGDDGLSQGICAACFVEESGEATVVFRETDQERYIWHDYNVPGNLDGTSQPEMAAAYIDRVSETYTNITVTGHAKGGNQAIIATLLRDGQINRCVSFDNQEFYETCENRLLPGQNKIMAINADNSPAGLLAFRHIPPVAASGTAAQASPLLFYLPSGRGASAGMDNHVIQIDTDSMRRYAEQIREARRRVANARTGLSLLFQTNEEAGEIGSILMNYFPETNEGYMDKCAAYLDRAANAFDKAESDIINRFDDLLRQIKQ